MAIMTDAVFFFRDGNIIKEMMMTEFDALLDGVVEAPEFRKQLIPAVFAQIDGQLKIRGLVFFLVGFTSQGNVVPEWNIPILQLLQSAGRGPDLGAGAIRLVCKSQCSVPWHQDNLWDPLQQTLQALVQTVKRNRLGILVEDEFALGESWNDIPTVAPGSVPPTLAPPTLAPPTLMPAMMPPVIAPPTLAPPTIAPVAYPESSIFTDIPVLAPQQYAQPQYVQPVYAQAPVAIPVAPAPPVSQNMVSLEVYTSLKQEFDAMRAGHSVRMDKIQKERDELKEKNKSIGDVIKQQAKEQLKALNDEFKQELQQKTQQIDALKVQMVHEQKRYAELKEQLVLQAQRYQVEREELVDQMKQDIDSDKIEKLKEAFKKELNARLEAETSKVNEALAMREVELFYREEQLKMFKDEIAHIKADKQTMLKESARQILQSLENNGVTLVAYNVGVGHITLPLEDVGRYLDERLLYLADRCSVSPEIFALWQEHYHQPVCHHVDEKGEVCNKAIKRTDLAAQYVRGESDRCLDHQPVKIDAGTRA